MRSIPGSARVAATRLAPSLRPSAYSERIRSGVSVEWLRPDAASARVHSGTRRKAHAMKACALPLLGSVEVRFRSGQLCALLGRLLVVAGGLPDGSGLDGQKAEPPKGAHPRGSRPREWVHAPTDSEQMNTPPRSRKEGASRRLIDMRASATRPEAAFTRLPVRPLQSVDWRADPLCDPGRRRWPDCI
jgi:hypothetical protein